MKRITIYTLVLISGFATVAQAVPFAELIDEDVHFFATVRSFSETRAQWEGHPIAELFEDEGLQGFFEAVASRSEAEAKEPGFEEVLLEEFGLTYEGLFELFPGQASLSVYNLAEMVLKRANRPEMVLMAEFSGDKDRMNELMQIQFERNAEAQKKVNPLVEHEMIEESFMGETLYFDETFNGTESYIEDGYALVDGIFILATPESRLRSAVEAIKEGSDTSITKTDVYLRSREASGRGDLSLYLNLVEVMPPLNAALIEQSMKSGLAMFGVTGQSLENALALESMQALFGDFDLIEAGLSSHWGFIYREKGGFLSLLTYAEGALPEANYVPEGVLSSTISLYDFGAMLANLEKILTMASPSLPMLLDIQMQTMQSNTGIDLRAAILENMGGELVSLSVLKEADRSATVQQPEQLFVIGVKDAESLSQAIETLKDLAPGARALIETQDYEGYTIHTIKAQANAQTPDAPVNDFSYVITRSHLIVNIGRLGLLHEVLSRMDHTGEGFWQLPETELLFEGIARPNAVTRSYVDLEQMVKPILQSIIQAASFGGLGKNVDPDKLPTYLDAPFHLISEVNEEPDGLFSRTLILKSEGSQ
jgi:hypothetical protein